MTIPAYPLQWPQGWKRAERTKPARFRNAARNWREQSLTIAEATGRLLEQLRQMGVDRDDLVISTNLQLRLDGLPRSNQREPEDSGAAVYWIDSRSTEPRCMAIDQYDRVADNIAAIAATLEAMRKIERHGGAEILNRAFTGFVGLPPPASDWRSVLDLPDRFTQSDLERCYRRARSKAHPDNGGSQEAFERVQEAHKIAQEHAT